MPRLGIIRGFGEGEFSTGYIIKLIKALRKRFRTRIDYIEIPTGDCMKYGCDLRSDVIDLMRTCDAIYAGDMESSLNPIDFKIEDVALALDNNIRYTCISGINNSQCVDMQIASYFDGGATLREGTKSINGCTETRICSMYSIKNIVMNISRRCEERRRRLAFVKDGDNEYCADLFYTKFEDFTLPLTNFHLIKFSTTDICRELLYDPNQFDTIFASDTFALYACGALSYMLKDEFISYTRFAEQKSVYSLKSVINNPYSNRAIPTMYSYITAFADLLRDEFKLEKEAIGLRGALERTVIKGISLDEGEEFIASVISELEMPLKSIYKTKPKASKYINRFHK